MRGLIKFTAGSAVALWTLLCWLGYAVGDVAEDWFAAQATWIGGDSALTSLIHALSTLGQGFGLIIVLLVWAIGVAIMLIPTMLLLRLFRRRQQIPGVEHAVWHEAPPTIHSRPGYSSAHTKKGSVLGKALAAARRYR